MTYQRHRISVALFAAALKFSAWLQNLPNKLTPPPFRLLQIGSAFWLSRCLAVAARLDIASVLADEALSVDEISKRTESQPEAIYRLLKMLAAAGIFQESTPRCYQNNKLSSYLRQDNPQNVRGMILMHNSPTMSQPWYEKLETAIRKGETPFKLSHGEDLFTYMSSHLDFNSLFSDAMNSVEALSGDSYVTDFNWQAFKRIIDLGGSRGSKSVSIMKRYPHLKALVLDHEHVVREARTYWQGREPESLLCRLTFQAGDILDAIPAAENGDVYLLSAVLHGFDDAMAVKLLKKIASAMQGTDARIAVMEQVVEEFRPDFTSTSFDMQMFMGTQGRERTLSEWQALLASSGLVLEEIVSLRSFAKILVLRPNS